MMFFTLLPFGGFAILIATVSSSIALMAAAGLSSILLIVDKVRGRSLKALQLTAGAAFAGIWAYVTFVDAHLSTHGICAMLNGSLLTLGLISMAMQVPFTMQYGRESVAPEIVRLPEFRRTNYLLTAVWTAAFTAMLAADLVSLWASWLPLWTGIAVAFVARNGAAAFTQWYVGVRRRLVEAKAALAPSVH